MTLKKYLLHADDRLITITGALAAFGTYSCMYAFRKPFTAATFDGLIWLGMDYKIWLIFAQTLGYTFSKFYGVRFISEVKHKCRGRSILILILMAWLALLFFPLVGSPYNIAFLLLNGFPLGMVWGLVFSYLEGRRHTEIMGAFLGVSFIFSSGFVKTVGAYLMVNYQVSPWWMPFFTGLIFVLPASLFVWLLNQMPAPNQKDEQRRNKRMPMTRADRRYFLRKYTPGITLLILSYVFLTLLRDIRDNFVANIWVEAGYGGQPGIFTSTELPISLAVLVIISLLVLVRSNLRAFLINHWLIMAGFLLILIATGLFSTNALGVVSWMILVGLGLYIAYVPFNCVIFDRFMAVFRHVGNAGFLMYLADSFGYLGSVSFLFYKELAGFGDMSWTIFFKNTLLVTAVSGFLITGLSALYFSRKYKMQPPART